MISWAFRPGTAIIVELIEEYKVKDAVIRLISIQFVHRATDELIWRDISSESKLSWFLLNLFWDPGSFADGFHHEILNIFLFCRICNYV